VSFAIICDARKDRVPGVKLLGLVDRKKSRRSWWTPDRLANLLVIETRKRAEIKAKKFTWNNARVVKLSEAVRLLNEQADNLAYCDSWGL